MKHAVSALVNEVVFWLLYIRMRFMKKKPQKAEGVLIIRFSHIGDFVLWLDAAKEFRKMYPGEKITFLCDRYKDVQILAEKTGFFDQVLVLETRGLGRLLGIRQAMRLRCRLAVQADPSRTVLEDIYMLAVQAQKRAAQKSDRTRMTKRQAVRSDRMYDQVIPCSGIQTMELIRNAQFIRGLGGNDSFRASLPQIPRLLPEHAVRRYLDDALRRSGHSGSGKYFVLCPGGETPQKYWAPEKYAAVLNDIFMQDVSMQCIVLGTAGEEAVLRNILRCVKARERITSLIGRTSLAEYTEIIRCADWLLSNDTSAAHIAAAAGTQAVVIAQSWDAGRFFPYRVERKTVSDCFPVSIHAQVSCAGCAKYGIQPNRWKCLRQGRVRCIDQIQAAQVISVVRQVMTVTEDDE